MKTLVFSPAAQDDIENIWTYSAENWGPDQADRYTDEIQDACLALTLGRRRGRDVAVRPGYLKCLTGSHVIYYRDRDDHIAIIRILHSRQDVGRHLA